MRTTRAPSACPSSAYVFLSPFAIVAATAAVAAAVSYDDEPRIVPRRALD